MLLEDYPKDDTEVLCERCHHVFKKTDDIKICFNCIVKLTFIEKEENE